VAEASGLPVSLLPNLVAAIIEVSEIKSLGASG